MRWTGGPVASLIVGLFVAGCRRSVGGDEIAEDGRASLITADVQAY